MFCIWANEKYSSGSEVVHENTRKVCIEGNWITTSNYYEGYDKFKELNSANEEIKGAIIKYIDDRSIRGRRDKYFTADAADTIGDLCRGNTENIRIIASNIIYITHDYPVDCNPEIVFFRRVHLSEL